MKELEPKRITRNILIAGGVAAALTGAQVETAGNKADAAEVVSIRCSTLKDVWYPMEQGKIIVVKTSAAVAVADVSVNGDKQFDGLGDTRTVIGMKTNDNSNKYFSIYNDYEGSMNVLRCSSTHTRFYTVLGKEAYRSDVRAGLNNPLKSVQVNIVKQ